MDPDIWTLNMSLARRFCPLSAQESMRAEKYRTHLHRYLRPSYMFSPTSTTPYIYSNSHKLCEQLIYRGRRRYGLRQPPARAWSEDCSAGLREPQLSSGYLPVASRATGALGSEAGRVSAGARPRWRPLRDPVQVPQAAMAPSRRDGGAERWGRW